MEAARRQLKKSKLLWWRFAKRCPMIRVAAHVKYNNN
jgi:hypothetical protein